MTTLPLSARKAHSYVMARHLHPVPRVGLETEDLEQEAWVAIVQALSRGRSDTPYLIGAAVNALASARRRFGQVTRSGCQRAHCVSLEHADGVAVEGPEGTVLRRLEGDVLVRALDALPDPYREAARLYYLGGLETAEVAARLGLKRGTVQSHLQQARKRLRRALA